MKAKIITLLVFTFLGVLSPQIFTANDPPTTPPFLHIDADNTTEFTDYPNTANGDLGEYEVVAQNNDDEETYFGAVVLSNWMDYNENNVPGYADGIDKFGNGQANACEHFTPLLIDIPPYQNSSSVRLIFRYPSSDPNQLSRESIDDQYVYKLPNEMPLRIWKKDGVAIRQPLSANQGGDFIAGSPNIPGQDQEYTLAELGWQSGSTRIRLYVEAVVVLANSSPIPITVEFYPDGTGSPSTMCSDRVKVLPFFAAANGL